MFFAPVPLRDDGPIDPAGVLLARSICSGCPVRADCFAEVMVAEGPAAEGRRHGIYAGLTGPQRAAVHRRDTARCYTCAEPFDALALITGELWCSCGPTDSAPIPDEGDQWLPRHTLLYNAITSWLENHSQVGERVPPPSVMVAKLHARKDDTHQIYRALVDGGYLLYLARGTYVRS